LVLRSQKNIIILIFIKFDDDLKIFLRDVELSAKRGRLFDVIFLTEKFYWNSLPLFKSKWYIILITQWFS